MRGSDRPRQPLGSIPIFRICDARFADCRYAASMRAGGSPRAGALWTAVGTGSRRRSQRHPITRRPLCWRNKYGQAHGSRGRRRRERLDCVTLLIQGSGGMLRRNLYDEAMNTSMMPKLTKVMTARGAFSRRNMATPPNSHLRKERRRGRKVRPLWQFGCGKSPRRFAGQCIAAQCPQPSSTPDRPHSKDVCGTPDQTSPARYFQMRGAVVPDVRNSAEPGLVRTTESKNK